MSRPKITTLLIEDSGLMRIILSDLLRKDPEIELLATASNGKEGVAKIHKLKPDVIITDMVMPESDGLEVVKTVMSSYPTPVILLSSLEKEDPKVFEALSTGAFDFLNKEEVASLARQNQYPLNELIKAAGEVPLEKLRQRDIKKNNHAHSFDAQLQYEIIAVGASTGGPSAVETLLQGLPANLSIPVVIAQHMPEHFLISFAKRLDKITPLKVKIAERNEVLCGGTVYIMPGNTNTHVIREPLNQNPVFRFTKRQYKEFNHPSVDGLLLSVAELYREKAIGVVMTGMGKDGTEGLKAIHQYKGYTIAQDASSSIVYGMPKSAVECGVVKQVLRLREIAGFLVSCLS
uniref:Protein-glutamate methylesterase/protein-glutamine glutaminase n=1 Tax=Roseihalotalea indica TaxID=2867963 RepID=A0AA49GRN4_9BACT|nr:chemotaxis-specific protein-glutamate methyltransferase CheB [Tunicatimonas sp. TK19036]